MSKKKEEKVKVNDDLNIDDLPDFDTEGDFDDIDFESRKPSLKETSKEFIKEGGKSFIDSLVKETGKKTLPDEYITEYSTLNDYVDITKEIYRDSKNKIKKSLYRTGREIKNALPIQSKLLDKFLDKLEDEEKQKTVSEEELKESIIQSNLSRIFDKQLEVTKALEAKRDAEEVVDKKERLGIGKLTLETLSDISKNTSSLNSFTLNISKEYYRQALELQYKEYFLQADLLKTSKDYFKMFSEQFDKLIKNTGLPDYVKLHNTEAVAELARQETVKNLYSNLFSNREYLNTVKKRLNSLAVEKVSNITNSINSLGDLTGTLTTVKETGGGDAVGNIISTIIGGVLGEKLSDKLSPKIKDKIQNNKYIKTGANYINQLSKSPSSFFSTMTNKLRDLEDNLNTNESLKNKLISKGSSSIRDILRILEPRKKTYEIRNKSILNHNKPAIFDNKVHRSITEVIPLYLSKILKESTTIRRMFSIVNKYQLNSFTDTNELIYDYENRKLDTKENVRINLENSLFNKKDILTRSVDKASESLIANRLSKSTPKENMILTDKETKNEFKKLLVTAKQELGNDLDYNSLFNLPSNAVLSKKILENNEKLQKFMDVLKTKDTDIKEKINDKLVDIGKIYPTSSVKNLFNIASKLSMSSIVNKLNEKEASEISKAFFKFIIRSGKDVVYSDILSGQGFKYLTVKNTKELLKKIQAFISDVKIIYEAGDISRKSAFEYSLSLVNSELRNRENIDPSVFKTIYEFSPDIQEKGKLGIENIIEGRLGIFEDDKNINVSTITEFTNSPTDIKRKTFVKTRLDMVNSLKKNNYIKTPSTRKEKTTLMNEIYNLKNKDDVVNFVKTKIEKSFNTSKNKITKLYKDSGKLFDDIANELHTVNISGNTGISEATKSAYLYILDKLEKKLEQLIYLEKELLEDKLKGIDEIRNKLTDNIADADILNELNNTSKLLKKNTNDDIEVLNKIKVKIAIQKDKLLGLNTSGNTSEINKSIITDIKKSVMELYTSFQKNLDELEAKRKNG